MLRVEAAVMLRGTVTGTLLDMRCGGHPFLWRLCASAFVACTSFPFGLVSGLALDDRLLQTMALW